MVQGRTFGPVLSMYTATNRGVLSVVLDEGAASCAAQSQGGEKLAIIFPCSVQTGAHPVVFPASGPPDCTGPGVTHGLLEEGSGFDIVAASGGEVSVSDAGDPLVGTFDISFGGGQRLRGAFEARRCPSD